MNNADMNVKTGAKIGNAPWYAKRVNQDEAKASVLIDGQI